MINIKNICVTQCILQILLYLWPTFSYAHENLKWPAMIGWMRRMHEDLKSSGFQINENESKDKCIKNIPNVPQGWRHRQMYNLGIQLFKIWCGYRQDDDDSISFEFKALSICLYKMRDCLWTVSYNADIAFKSHNFEAYTRSKSFIYVCIDMNLSTGL